MRDDFDPLAPETFDSPHEDYRRLRKECPVAHSSAWGGFWAYMKHADVCAAASDSSTYITSKQNVIPKVAFTGRRPPLHLDPPEHTPYRRALAPLLTEKKVARLEPVIASLCDELLEKMIAKGGGDLCAEYSAHVPIVTFSHWMNLPADQIAELAETGRTYNIAVQSNDMETTKQSSLKLYDMARALLKARKEAPLDPALDATTALLEARYEGEPLPEDLIVGTIRQVLVVGIIAPTVTFGAVGVHLARDRALQTKLREQPDLIPEAIEEFLRLYTPYRGFARTATEDVCKYGRTIKAGEPIALVYASANRDEEVFEAPDEFRLGRENMKDSLAFGRGVHSCVGAPLARLQMKVALERLLAKTKGFSLAGEPVQTRFPEIGALKAPLAFE
ncbi:cytochrome P450 [Hyphococcus sp.]|uniref:cytochrome P450 n=1 Tax=Hyphococcus sp. TaxID=2038636 RepID=UPI003D1513D5